MTDQIYPMVIVGLSDDEGGGFMAFAPDLRGCRGDGSTPEEAIVDLHGAIKEWKDEAVRLGRKIPEPNSVGKRLVDERARLQKKAALQERLIEALKELNAEQSDAIREQEKKIVVQQEEVEDIKRKLAELSIPDDCDEDAVWMADSILVAASALGGRKRKVRARPH